MNEYIVTGTEYKVDPLTIIAATAFLRVAVRPDIQKVLTAYDVENGELLIEVLRGLGVELRPIDPEDAMFRDEEGA